VSLGVGKVSTHGSWEAGVQWTHWSVMKSVVVDLDPIEVDGQSLVVEEFVVNDWSDAWAVRFGVRRFASPKLSWAAGAYWDQSPVPARTADPLLPDSDRLSVTGGLTWTLGRFDLDVAAQVVRFAGVDSRGTTNPFPAEWDAFVASLAVTAGWRFGGAAR
jgi:long-subunit fatty acid transport protein